MSETAPAYHHAHLITIIDGDGPALQLNGRMANVIRAVISGRADIENTCMEVRITINCAGNQTKMAVQKFY